MEAGLQTDDDSRRLRVIAVALIVPALILAVLFRPGSDGEGVDIFDEEVLTAELPVADAEPMDPTGALDRMDVEETESVPEPDESSSEATERRSGEGKGQGVPDAGETLAETDEAATPDAIALADDDVAAGAVLDTGQTETIQVGPPAQNTQVEVSVTTSTTTTVQAAADVDGEAEDGPIAETPEPSLWCEVEVRSTDGIIRWGDDGRTAVIRKNDAWFHTPAEQAVAVQIPEAVDTTDEYLLRVWGGGGSDDVVCTYVAGATATSTTTTTTTTTTTSTTTTVPEAVAFVDLPSPIAVPGGPVQMGFNVDLWGDERTAYWNDLEAVPGNGRLIAHEFKSFSKSLNMSLYRWHMNEGRDLLLTWNGTTASSIVNGTHDDWIRDHARQLKTLPGTVMLRFWHEPDVSYKASWIEGDPQNYVDAWMHTRRIFVEEGATANIEWVWCPTAWNWEQQGALFYPGDANVDWICADGYSGMNLDKPLGPIADEFTAFQAWANQHPTKPIIIAEFGATAREPGDRAAWVRQIPSWVTASPNIRAVVYFDYDKRSEQPWDWRLRTEPDAWQAMMDVLSSTPFG